MSAQFHEVADYLRGWQERLCEALGALDGGTFGEDSWERPEGGGGCSRVLTGAVFEQAGVNFSAIHGNHLPAAASAARPALGGLPFRATGVSVVLHPRNPYVPTTHCNLRYFEAGTEQPVWWMGGGFDLTPYYGFDEDAIHWHRMARDACALHGKDSYRRFKAWCDEYFVIRHRQEQRGIGGLFFDDLHEGGFTHNLAFLKRVAEAFQAGYEPIVQRRAQTPYGQRERDFQLYRRGRYVEFNLVYDRGTLFGLQSGGRTESILMSLPPEVRFRYNWQPRAGTPEALLYERYLQPRDWLSP